MHQQPNTATSQSSPPSSLKKKKLYSQMAKTVLITGASGFIAAHTVNAFLRQGYHVRGAVRSERSAAEVKATHKEYATQLSLVIVPDITAPNAFDDAVKGVDGVSQLPSTTMARADDVRLFTPLHRSFSMLKTMRKSYWSQLSRELRLYFSQSRSITLRLRELW